MKKERCIVLSIVSGLFLFFSLSSCNSLESAAFNDDMPKARALIQKGADVNKGGLKISSPLQMAMASKDTAMVGLLLQHGAKIDLQASDGNTVLHWAVNGGDSTMVRYFIEKGANVNLVNNKGLTPQMIAEKNGFTAIGLLLKNSAEIRAAALTKQLANPVNDKPVTISTATSVVEEPFKVSFSPFVRVIKPIPQWIWATAISGIESPSSFKNSYGNITDWGYGLGVEMATTEKLSFFADLTNYMYKLEIAEKGEAVHPHLGNAESAGVSSIVLDEGAKYSTNTSSLRLGIKYGLFKDKWYQPWFGLAYGLNVTHVKYLTWDEDGTYGKATVVKLRPAILLGIDLKTNGLGTYAFFFEAISPTSEYVMKDLFGLGDYDTHGGAAEVTYPTPRLGFSITFR